MAIESRSIGTPRTPITRGGNIIQTSIDRNLFAPSTTGIGTGRDMSGRRVATAEEIATYRAQIPITQDAINRINQFIRDNAPKYIDVPRNDIYNPGNQATSTSPTTPETFYGTGDPFAVLSDVFRNVFGSSGDPGISKQTGQALVPVTSSSGGGNTFVIFIIIAGIAGIAYYLYKRSQ